MLVKLTLWLIDPVQEKALFESSFTAAETLAILARIDEPESQELLYEAVYSNNRTNRDALLKAAGDKDLKRKT